MEHRAVDVLVREQLAERRYAVLNVLRIRPMQNRHRETVVEHLRVDTVAAVDRHRYQLLLIFYVLREITNSDDYKKLRLVIGEEFEEKEGITHEDLGQARSHLPVGRDEQREAFATAEG